LVEESAILTKRAKSLSLPRFTPSAMFAEIEAAERRSWDVNPNCSLGGKACVEE